MSNETPDQVDDVLAPYQGEFLLWGGKGQHFQQGSVVPAVGMASTYAVFLDAPEGAPDRFLWVQEGEVTRVMVHQPIPGKSVFDARGAFLGTGGKALERPDFQQASTATLIEMLAKDLQPHVTTIRHRFYFRPGRSFDLDLPDDLTPREAERIADFIRVLPFPSEISKD